LVFDQQGDFSGTAADIAKRPYITVGFVALVLLVPLAATSTASMVKRLGAKRWRRLHRAVYVVAALGVVHYLWSVKADTSRPLTYGAAFAVLFAVRGFERLRIARRKRAASRSPA
jgi:sulfoxide reductase heme-binding subunit YedZ